MTAYILGAALGLFFGIGLTTSVLATKPSLPMVCAGHKYLQPDGSWKCEPKQECPKGPRGG